MQLCNRLITREIDRNFQEDQSLALSLLLFDGQTILSQPALQPRICEPPLRPWANPPGGSLVAQIAASSQSRCSCCFAGTCFIQTFPAKIRGWSVPSSRSFTPSHKKRSGGKQARFHSNEPYLTIIDPYHQVLCR